MRAAVALLGLCLLSVCFITGACSAPNAEVHPQDALERAVSIATTACGHASRTSGAGVIVEEGLVLASAHVVIGAGSVSVDGVTAQILKIDTQADLALLEVLGVTAPAVQFAAASAGDSLTIIGGGPSPSFQVRVTRAVEVRIEEVRSTTRSSRLAYELDTRVALGDSGAGAFNSQGRMVGTVFGRIQSQGDRSFVVQSSEIANFLADDSDTSYVCDPLQHRVIPTEQ